MRRAYRKFGWQMSAPSSTSRGASSGANPGSVASWEKTPVSGSHSHSYFGNDWTSALANFVRAVTPSASPTSTSTSTASDSKESGEVAATPADDGAEYLSKVTVGGQEMNLNFDTGSADLWVFSSYLSKAEIGEHSVYDPSKSSSFSNYTGASFSISYGDGSGAKGNVGYDTVDIGGATVQKQAIELATSVSQAFVDDADSDGLVGLAFPSINSVKPNPQNTFFTNIMDELEQPLFTVDLDADGSGTYEFGVIDSSKYTGEIVFTAIDTSSGYWQFDSPKYSIGGTVKTRSNGSPAIADTGTSLLLLDPAVVEDFYSQVDGAFEDDSVGGYTYPCSAKLPDFAVSIGDEYMAKLTGAELTYAQVSQDTCFGGIQSNGGSGLQIYGDVLLQQQFVVFHGKEGLLGMADKA
ncbi:hypothetical protein AAFC00_006911 [Neodothiora populina]|uniref:Peptidase A1 domain-containing protein n=1 Tax=Neodothiora populina TaxID=2781224 RepID=A0ABR3PBK9_9PEZI